MLAAGRADDVSVSSLGAVDPIWRPLGDVLLQRGLITEAQLRQALDEQQEEGGRLGEILFARGWVSPIELRDALAEQHGLDLRVESTQGAQMAREPHTSSFALGQLLVHRGDITERQLDTALAEQSKTKQRLGQILIAHGAVTGFALAAALAEQQGLVSTVRELWEAAQNDPAGLHDHYDVLEIEGENQHRLYSSRSFLDATDLAFAVLHECGPAELQVVRVNRGVDREICWKYPPS
jgi:hypothetical protein